MQRLLFIFVAVLLASCSQQNNYAEINFAIAQAPLNLDPRYATDASSERVNRLIYQPLVDFDDASKPAPVLATWVLLSPTRYQFNLVPQRAVFHHKTALTASDVKATYDSILGLKNSPHTAEFANIKNIKIINVESLIFELKQSDSHFPSKLIIGILPADLIAKNHDFAHHPIGSGPLKIVSWNSRLVLQRIRDNQLIRLTEVKDPTVRVLKLQRGEADLIQGDLPPELVKHLQSQPEIKVKTTAGANFSYLGLNMQDATLQNLKVRQAIAYAIDREAIIRQVMVQQSRVASSILPPEHYTNANNNLASYDYNPEKAKQLLLEAGIKLPLKLIYKTSTDAQRLRFSTILQAQMAKAGIDLQIKSLDWGTFFADVKQGNFQLFGLTWVGIKTPEIYAKAFGSDFFPPNGFNRGRYADKALDNLLAKEDWPAAMARIQQQLPYIPLWYEGQFAAMGKNIKGYAPKADGNWDDLTNISLQKVVK
ncbi:MAG: ABC transporter substrate-binding protein [Methylotenera sp.]|nr:ABC transporter substrate-binding protein [Methylotenera sp.]